MASLVAMETNVEIKSTFAAGSTFAVGSTFNSYEEFEIALKEYCDFTHQRFVIGGCKKVTTLNKRLSRERENCRKPLFPERLMYSYIQYRCIRQGEHRTTSKGIRKSTSYRDGCEAVMYIKGDREKGVLEVKRLISEHNHPTGPDVSYRKASRIRYNPTKSRKKHNVDPSPQKSGRTVGVTDLQNMVRAIIPPLNPTFYKGQSGRIGIIGGCQEYTGAPYFAAISSLKVGADLSHVFCTKDAATVIKSYSPELIVHPILDHPQALAEFEKWLPRLHTLVVGPGLGRDPLILETVSAVIRNSKSRGIPLVIDADGLFLVTESPDLVVNYPHTLLTPNAIEFQRLFEKMIGDRPSQCDQSSNVKLLSQCLGNITILRKGMEDIISDGFTVIMCSTDGSPRRCGGQGDLLAGSTAVFFNWALMAHNVKAAEAERNQPPQVLGSGVIAAYMACRLTRECSRLAFAEHGRSMTTSDMIVHIHPAFEGLFTN